MQSAMNKKKHRTLQIPYTMEDIKKATKNCAAKNIKNFRFITNASLNGSVQ